MSGTLTATPQVADMAALYPSKHNGESSVEAMAAPRATGESPDMSGSLTRTRRPDLHLLIP